MAPQYKAYDMITGEAIIPNMSTCFTYTINPNRSSSSKLDKAVRKYVLVSTYENAYANNDIEIIQKLQAVGLKPGFNFSYAAEDSED